MINNVKWNKEWHDKDKCRNERVMELQKERKQTRRMEIKREETKGRRERRKEKEKAFYMYVT